MFDGLRVSVRRYAARRHRDAGSVSRYLNRTRIPPWEFVSDLMHDVAEEQGAAPTPEAMELLRQLHRKALAVSGSTAQKLQLLEDQLADADREVRRSAVRERALTDALLDAQHRAADLEVQIGQLHADHDRDRSETRSALQLHEDQLGDLRDERAELLAQVEILEEELREAHTLRLRAEARCEVLERQLDAIDNLTERTDTPERGEARQGQVEDEAVSAEETLLQKVGGEYFENRVSTSRHAPVSNPRLNSKYLFETFVVGASNHFAHAAAVAAAEAPAKAYNPLFIYGESGIGKTHLLHGIGNYARSLYPGVKVQCVSSEEFTNEFINSIRDGKTDAFRNRYRDVDILLVDDVQFLSDKEVTQEEFFHTFNTLHNANKQIVLSSDRPPKQLLTVDERLRKRFEWGLVTDIKPPELETRIAILRKKAMREQLNAPVEVLEFIAARIRRSIRELEGAVLRVAAFAALNRREVDIELTNSVLSDMFSGVAVSDPQGAVTGDLVIELTGDYFGVADELLRGRDGGRVATVARQMAMYLCRELTSHSATEIGSLFDGRERTAVDRAQRRIRELMKQQGTVYEQVTELTQSITGSSLNPAVEVNAVSGGDRVDQGLEL
ncbi:chromosomal replication initiator protein DnaA [Streptomyces sp. NA02950]|nr:chromosomal replication initiator protein DnaA [Streptomyces sp. NA02950]